MIAKPLNISFLRSIPVEAQGEIDKFILHVGSVDADPDTLTLEELESSAKVERYSKLFQRISVNNCYRDVRAYLIARGLAYTAKRTVDGDSTFWVAYELLTGGLDNKYIGDIVGAYHFAYPDLPVHNILRNSSVLHGGAWSLGEFEKSVGHLPPERVVDLLRSFDDYTSFSKGAATLVLLKVLSRLNSNAGKSSNHDKTVDPIPSAEASRRPVEKDIETAPPLAAETSDRPIEKDIETAPTEEESLQVKRGVKTELAADIIVKMLGKDLISRATEIYEDAKGGIDLMKSMTDISYVWTKIHEAPSTTGQFFRDYPIDRSSGARIARLLAGTAILNKGHVKALADIVKNDGYDIFTRASVAWALGQSEYKDKEARYLAVDSLVRFLRSIRTCEWPKQKISRVVFEAVIALGQLGVAKTDNNNIVRTLAYYVTDLSHPPLRLAATVAYGCLGVAVDRGSQEFKDVRDILFDALGDDEEMVRVSAYKSLYRIFYFSVRQ